VQADPDIHLNKKNIKNQKVFFFFWIIVTSHEGSCESRVETLML
jgi:hypothetical protein